MIIIIGLMQNLKIHSWICLITPLRSDLCCETSAWRWEVLYVGFQGYVEKIRDRIFDTSWCFFSPPVSGEFVEKRSTTTHRTRHLKLIFHFLYLWFLLMLKVKMERRLISLFISCRLVSVVSSRCLSRRPSRRSCVEEEAHFMTNTYTLKQNCCVCYVQVTSYSPICFCLEMID